MDHVDDLLAELPGDRPDDSVLRVAAVIDRWEFENHAGNLIITGISLDQKIVTNKLTGAGIPPIWVRTGETVYRLGWPANNWPPIIEAAMAPTWFRAFRLTTSKTVEATLDGGCVFAVSAMAADADRELIHHETPDWPMRTRCAGVISRALNNAGRHFVADAWELLSADTQAEKSIAKICAALHDAADNINRTEGADRMLAGWRHIEKVYENVTRDFFSLTGDFISLSHKFGARVSEGKTKSLADEIDEQKAIPPGNGVFIINSIGGTSQNNSGREARNEFKDLIGKYMPLARAPDMSTPRRTLHDEFPHATAELDVLFGGLIEGEVIAMRPTLLVGEPGGGKTRIARRVAESVNIHLHRYDGSGSSDNAFGGTARRWSSGEHCVPLEAVRRSRIANPWVLIDEIDKSGDSRHNGSLDRALLPFLEAENARAYPDPYVESTVDLSHVGYILTCNDDKLLPGPLRDRLRIVRLPRPAIDHLPQIARTIVSDIARDRGGDARWYPALDDGELMIAETLWAGGSVRRLRNIIERLLAHRESRPRN